MRGGACTRASRVGVHTQMAKGGGNKAMVTTLKAVKCPHLTHVPLEARVVALMYTHLRE